MVSERPDIRCPGCGLRTPPIQGPTHEYLGANPACWALYGELLAFEYGGEDGLPNHHRLAVDAYAVQHPGVDGHRQRQSVGFHLCRLSLVLEQGMDPAEGQRAAEAISARPPDWIWLDPPVPNGDVRVRDVLAGSPADLEQRVWAWARDVWSAWSPNHGQVDAWLAEVGLKK